MKHCLRLSSVIVLLVISSCSTPYKNLQQAPVSQSAYRFQPEADRTLYRCIVDGRFILKKFHLSGVLFFKRLKTGTIRAIFQNEMGMAFFDMEWKEDGAFEVKQILPQLDKEAVVKTLRKDMEMLLMLGMDKKSEIMLQQDRGKAVVHRLNRTKGYVYYTIDSERLVKIEHTDKRKKIVSIDVTGTHNATAMPDTVLFEHHKANFTISLSKI